MDLKGGDVQGAVPNKKYWPNTVHFHSSIHVCNSLTRMGSPGENKTCVS